MPRTNISKIKKEAKDGSGPLTTQVKSSKKSLPNQQVSKGASLLNLMLDKLAVEEQLEKEGGSVEGGLDIIWEQKDVAVKEKIDHYGWVFLEIEAGENKLNLIQERIQVAKKRLSDLRTKLKARLNHFSNGEPLIGTAFSFHPYNTKHSSIDVSKLNPSETYLTIEITKDKWIKMVDAYYAQEGYPITEVNGELIAVEESIGYTVKSEHGKVSELPEGHPAITVESNPSVRMT